MTSEWVTACQEAGKLMPERNYRPHLTPEKVCKLHSESSIGAALYIISLNPGPRGTFSSVSIRQSWQSLQERIT